MTTTHNSCCEKCANGSGKYALAIARPYCINSSCPCHTSKASSWPMVEEEFDKTFPSHISMNKGLQEFIRTHLDAAYERGYTDGQNNKNT